jgi:superfamily I DNA/RNA helicase
MVKIMSIHASKGNEFKYVILINFEPDIIAKKWEHGTKIFDSLIHVGLTRSYGYTFFMIDHVSPWVDVIKH